MKIMFRIRLALASALVWFIFSGLSQAATFTVDSTLDEMDSNICDCICRTASNTCTLRAAIQEANCCAGDDTIILPAGLFTLTGSLLIGSNLVITGTTPTATIIDGNLADRVFLVDAFSPAVVTISNLMIRNGKTQDTGGGIKNDGSNTLNLNNIIIQGNSAQGGGGLSNIRGVITILNTSIRNNQTGGGGGGINNYQGNIKISNSTLNNNQASDGGGIFSFPSPPEQTTNLPGLELINVTISGNEAFNHAGLYIEAYETTEISIITNCTIQGNYSTLEWGSGNGIYSYGLSPVLKNTIVANNSRGNCSKNIMEPITSAGHNISSDDTCGFNSPGDYNNTDPRLGPLQDNGGPTWTHALLNFCNKAIDGADGCPGTDQRGVARPQGTACDIGSFEFQGYANPCAQILLPLILK